MDVIDGGALLPITGFFVGSGRSSHTATQEGRPVSQADLDATNTLQQTAWQIDTGVLTVAKQARDTGHPCLGVDLWSRPKMPPRIEPEAFAALDRDARSRVGRMRREVRDDIIAWDGEVQSIGSTIQVAHDCAEMDRFWFTWSHDARLRRYPRVSEGPSPQGSGLSRSLIRFADGVELGEQGLWWLQVRLAGAAGHDKLDHQSRCNWTLDNMERLLEAAERPLENDFWWRDERGRERDDPWAVLATIWEIRDALLSGNPAGFRSKLPVHVDGTCNGLQHLSAMGLDPIGATATNLTSDQKRHDIYEEVAAHVRRAAEALKDSEVEFSGKLSSGDPWSIREADLADRWLPNITRALVKRGTMTTPYGVTARGIAVQLIEDEFVTKEQWGEGVHLAAAGWIRDRMVNAIGDVVVSARDTMKWLQETAAVLAKANKPFEWITPMGSRIRQAYHPWNAKRLTTAFGRVTVATSVDKTQIKHRKQELASAPNFVHSFDAAHLAATINAGDAAGITHWAAIHDSYGTHAARMNTLANTIRQEFVTIYEHDWLTSTHHRIETMTGLTIKPPPARGTFDISEVLSSPWFFA